MNRVTWTVLLGLLGLGLVALFWAQNRLVTTQLSFDLGFAAWQLREPVQVPLLMALCVGAGFLLGGFPMLVRGWGQSSRIAELEQRLAAAELDKGATAPKEPGTW